MDITEKDVTFTLRAEGRGSKLSNLGSSWSGCGSFVHSTGRKAG